LDRIVLSLAVAVVAIALPHCINPSLIGGEVFFGAGPVASTKRPSPKSRSLERAGNLFRSGGVPVILPMLASDLGVALAIVPKPVVLLARIWFPEECWI
jgi:hypothetical protein